MSSRAFAIAFYGWTAVVVLAIVLIPANPRPLNRSLDELPSELVIEAFDAVRPSWTPSEPTYCLAYGHFDHGKQQWVERDPPFAAEFHFRRRGLAAHRISLCPLATRSAFGTLALRDTLSDRPVMILTLQDSVAWLEDEAHFAASYACGSLCGGGGPVTALWHRGRWHVRFEVTFVS